jgi:enoyl-CoA hydratase/carnithine racemase
MTMLKSSTRTPLITVNRPDVLNATNERLHWELSKVWLDVSDDRDTRIAVITGAGRAFSALLTADFIDGREAERIGLVSRCAPAEQVLPFALEIAEKLARGPQLALRWTRRAINNWLCAAGPIFGASLALEMLNFFDDDVREGVAALLEKRPPVFPSTRPD